MPPAAGRCTDRGRPPRTSANHAARVQGSEIHHADRHTVAPQRQRENPPSGPPPKLRGEMTDIRYVIECGEVSGSAALLWSCQESKPTPYQAFWLPNSGFVPSRSI